MNKDLRTIGPWDDPDPQKHSEGSDAAPACVDAETLAAWADGTLPPNRAHVVESHLADCARCQAMLGAFSSTDADNSQLATNDQQLIPFVRRRPSLRVITIAGAIAASLLIWVVVRDPDATTPVPEVTMSRNEQPLAQQSNALPATPAEGQIAAAAPPPKQEAREETKPTDRRRDAAAAKTVGAETRKADPAVSERQLATQTAETLRTTQAAPPPAPATAPPVAGASPTPTPLPVFRAAVPPPAATQVQSSAVMADSLARSATVAPALVAEFSSPPPLPVVGLGQTTAGAGRGGGGGGAGVGAGRTGAAAAPPTAARTANEAIEVPRQVRWRILRTGMVERSANDGATWQTVAIEPAEPGLTAGMAPSPMVCWLVGRNGVVLLSTDGVRFTRAIRPVSDDLVLIRATSAREATVTTADGRTFTTTDGGQTWK